MGYAPMLIVLFSFMGLFLITEITYYIKSHSTYCPATVNAFYKQYEKLCRSEGLSAAPRYDFDAQKCANEYCRQLSSSQWEPDAELRTTLQKEYEVSRLTTENLFVMNGVFVDGRRQIKPKEAAQAALEYWCGQPEIKAALFADSLSKIVLGLSMDDTGCLYFVLWLGAPAKAAAEPAA